MNQSTNHILMHRLTDTPTTLSPHLSIRCPFSQKIRTSPTTAKQSTHQRIVASICYSQLPTGSQARRIPEIDVLVAARQKQCARTNLRNDALNIQKICDSKTQHHTLKVCAAYLRSESVTQRSKKGEANEAVKATTPH